MKKLFSDFYANAFAQTMLLLIPFITLGLIGNEVILYAACSIEAICLAVFIIRLIFVLKSHKSIDCPKFGKDFFGMMTLPYSMALSSLILATVDIDAQSGLWFSLILTAIIIITCLATAKK